MVFGVIVVAVFLGGFGAWAAFAPLESAAIAQGVVSVSGKRKTVQHLEGGIVAGILVKEGEVVAAGQVLVVLEDTRARASFSLLQAQYRSAAALKARLEAERDNEAGGEAIPKNPRPPVAVVVDGGTPMKTDLGERDCIGWSTPCRRASFGRSSAASSCSPSAAMRSCKPS